MRCEVPEQIELASSRTHDFSLGRRDLPAPAVNDEAAHVDALHTYWTFFAAAKHCLYARHQLPRGEWLGHVVVRPNLQPHDLVHFRVTRRQHDDRYVRVATDAPTDLYAVHSR